MSDPAPCPFCAGSAKAVAMPPTPGASMAFMHVECQACGASGPTAAGVDPRRAVEYWNNRRAPAPPDPATCEHAKHGSWQFEGDLLCKRCNACLDESQNNQATDPNGPV